MISIEELNILSLLVTSAFLWHTLSVLVIISLVFTFINWRYRIKILNPAPLTYLELIFWTILIVLILINCLIIFNYGQLL